MGITINELIEFCEEEEYTHRIRCKQYDDASGFTRSGSKDIRTACAIREEIKGNYYQQMINTMRKYQRIVEICETWYDKGLEAYDSMWDIIDVIEGGKQVNAGSNLDNSSMRSDQGITEHHSNRGTGKE